MLTIDVITAEATRLFRNASWYWREQEKIWGYDWHVFLWLIENEDA